MSKRESPWELAVGPQPERWDDWSELDASAWPEKREKHYRLIPTICFNCESACGLLAYVDRETESIVKFEGNPVHPGSRGRTCAKGPATINQVTDPERIKTPLKRTGPRGSGQFEPVSWEAALDDIGSRIATAFDEDRHNEIMYHVGRPGDDHFVARMLSAWGIDGMNSHTNVCSGSARFGYAMWSGVDRPSPDFSASKFILLLSAHLETGHYFNPHAQRIVSAKEDGARMAVIDTRLSNTTTHADLWISSWPGSEAALLLAVAHLLIARDQIDRKFLKRWTNWEQTLEAQLPGATGFDAFVDWLKTYYARYTPAFAAEECRIPEEQVVQLADEIAAAGSAFSSHLWRNAASGNRGGWQVARALTMLHVLTGSIGVEGGVNPNTWDKFVPKPTQMPGSIGRWNEAIWPPEWPLAHYEMSFLLPHLLEKQQRRLDVYFTRVYNPVWTNPDGCSWIEMLEDEERVGCHVALTPIWSESAQWADYILPMGLAPERHDLMSQETHAGTWIGFRQPVMREYARREGREVSRTHETNPGEVWEEAEFWIDLSWRIDPDGTRGIREYFESSKTPGSPITLDEYYADIFENQVPGLVEAAAAEELTPLDYMRRYGAFEVPYEGRERYERPVDSGGVAVEDGSSREGFKTPSGKLEMYSKTIADWGWPDQALPDYQRSHVHWRELEDGQMVLLPTFRLPTLIHTRSGNAKWLQEISHTNPLWIHPQDAERLDVRTGKLVRIETAIGWFVLRGWVTEGIHPGVVACSHHAGRWRTSPDSGGERSSSSLVGIERKGTTFLFRQRSGATPFTSNDPDTARVWWQEIGVNQNLAFPVQPDPQSGMHCWHQKVKVTRAQPGDRYGDILVDTKRSREVFEQWLAMTKPAPGPDGTRRPGWLNRPMHPKPECYRME